MIDQNYLVNIFKEIVKIDSPTGEEEKLSEFIIHFFDERGFGVFKDSFGNLIVHIDGIGEPLFLSAHMDTVEPGRGIVPDVKNGVLKSKGDTILGADNKDALSALLFVSDYLIKNKVSHRPLDIVFTRYEESECLGAVKLNYKKLKSKTGFIFDAAKPIGTIILSSPYYLRFDIEIIGDSAHASRPEVANNAILVFSDAMKNIKLGKIDEKTIANIGFINSGHVRNTIPGQMMIKGEVRSFQNKVVEKEAEKIVKEFNKSAKKFGSKIKSEIVLENPGYVFSKDDEIVKFAEKILNENNVRIFKEDYHGCSDANIFNDKNMKILNLGNGSKFSHTVNEEISVKDLVKLSNIILSLVTSKI